MSIGLFEKIELKVVEFAYPNNFCHTYRFKAYLSRYLNPTDYLYRDGTVVRTSYGCL